MFLLLFLDLTPTNLFKTNDSKFDFFNNNMKGKNLMNCISNPSSTTNKNTSNSNISNHLNNLGSFVFNNNMGNMSNVNSQNSNSFNKKAMHGNFASTFVCTQSHNMGNMGMMFNPSFAFPQNCTTPTNNSSSDSKSIIIENIISGKDKRTTIMLRNIPLKYNITNLTEEINTAFAGKFDFINMPINLDVRVY